MPTGASGYILATDPGAVKDFQAFSKQTGNTLLSLPSRSQVIEVDADGNIVYRNFTADSLLLPAAARA